MHVPCHLLTSFNTQNVTTAFVFDAFMIQFENAEEELHDRQSTKSKHRQLERQEKIEKEKQIQRQRKKNARNARSRRVLQGFSRPKSSQKNDNETTDQQQLPLISSIFPMASFGRPTSNDSVISNQDSLEMEVSEDVLDQFIEELNSSKKENWRKWIIMAMLFEFDTKDVIKGVWMLSVHSFYILFLLYVDWHGGHCVLWVDIHERGRWLISMRKSMEKHNVRLWTI